MLVETPPETSEERRVGIKIGRIKEKARDRGIGKKALFVLRYLSNGDIRLNDGVGIYKDNNIQITPSQDGCAIKIPEPKEWKTVFEGGKEVFIAGSPGVEATKTVTGLGGVEYTIPTTYGGSNSENFIRVNTYIPGKWEKYLCALYLKTQGKQKEVYEENKRKKAKELERLKDKWGL